MLAAVERPKQRIPSSQKGDKWMKNNGDYYSAMCSETITEDRIAFLYKLANGLIEASEYLYVVNPLNTDKKEFQGYPSKIRNMDIISPVREVLVGEKINRFTNGQVIARNSNLPKVREEVAKKLWMESLATMMRNQLQQQGNDVGQPTDDRGNPTENPLDPEAIRKKTEKIQDIASQQGQAVLDYISWYQELERKFKEQFDNYLSFNHTGSYKCIRNEEVHYEDVPVQELYYMPTPGLQFLEDAPAIKRVTRMNINEVLDRFQGMKGFTPEVISSLEETAAGTGVNTGNAGASLLFKNLFGTNAKSTGNYSAEDIYVEHIVWTGQIKVGVWKTMSLFGEPIEVEVDEDFLPREGDVVEWHWISTKYNIYILDGQYYVGGEEIPLLRGTKTAPEKVRNPYNGRIPNLSTAGVEPKSLLEKGYSYQVKHNVVNYYIERSIAKNLDKLILFPKGLMDEEYGEKGTMYFAQADSFLFTKALEGGQEIQKSQQIRVLDASLANYINNLTAFLDRNKAEWEQSIGITRERKGEQSNREGKAVMEQAIYRGSIMTERTFTEQDEFEQRELQGLLELGKFAFVGGKESQYQKTDGSIKFLSLDVETFVSGDYFVTVSNSGRDATNREAMRGQALAFAQNQVAPSAIGRLIKATSIDDLIRDLDTMEQEVGQRTSASEQAKFNQEMQLKLVEQNIAKMNVDQKEADSIRRYYAALYGKEPNQAPDANSVQVKQGGESTTTGNQEGIVAMQEQTKRQGLASKERIEKMKSETALKNKVSGEK